MPPNRPSVRAAVLLSGTGRTLENLLLCIARGDLPLDIRLVVSGRAGVRGLEIAAAAGMDAVVDARSASIFERLRRERIALVLLAGWLRRLRIPEDYRDRVLNIHPSLLPRHGGRGCYGHRVHQAVLAAGDHESGCTVHLVDDEYDHGPVILQERVPVLPGDDADRLAARVFEAEQRAYPEAIRRWLAGRTLLAHP